MPLSRPTAPIPVLDLGAARRLRTLHPAWAPLGGMRVAEIIRTLRLDDDPRGRRVVVLCREAGPSDPAWLAARWLACWGAHVVVITWDTPSTSITPSITLRARPTPRDADVDLILDGLGGLHATAPEEAIRWMDAAPSPVVAIDLPSGLDADTGRRGHWAVYCVATIAIGAPNDAVLNPDVSDEIGEVYTVDIGILPEQWELLGGEALSGACFAGGPLLSVR
jgi:NAD(P)H-hydrate repair Nnr-like enzyme with NAD(P)H-hydrate epimerase domain